MKKMALWVGLLFAVQALGAGVLTPKNALAVYVAKGAKPKVTLYVYSSLLCPHCAVFSSHGGLAHVKKKYIDTGKIRLVEMPFGGDHLSAQALSVVWSVKSRTKREAVLQSFYTSQARWVSQEAYNDPVEGARLIRKLAHYQGLTKAQVNQALKKARVDKVQKKLKAITKKAASRYDITGTPSFVLHGKIVLTGWVEGWENKLDIILDEALGR